MAHASTPARKVVQLLKATVGERIESIFISLCREIRKGDTSLNQILSHLLGGKWLYTPNDEEHESAEMGSHISLAAKHS